MEKAANVPPCMKGEKMTEYFNVIRRRKNGERTKTETIFEMASLPKWYSIKDGKFECPLNTHYLKDYISSTDFEYYYLDSEGKEHIISGINREDYSCIEYSQDGMKVKLFYY